VAFSAKLALSSSKCPALAGTPQSTCGAIRLPLGTMTQQGAQSDQVSIWTATLFPKTGQVIDPDDINNFIIMADKAFYFSKQSGKNRVTHFNDLVLNPKENLSTWKIHHETPTDH